MVLKAAEDKEVVVIGECWNYLLNVILALMAEKLVRKGYKISTKRMRSLFGLY